MLFANAFVFVGWEFANILKHKSYRNTSPSMMCTGFCQQGSAFTPEKLCAVKTPSYSMGFACLRAISINDRHPQNSYELKKSPKLIRKYVHTYNKQIHLI